MREQEDPVRIEAKCIRETSAAILVEIGEEEVWIPKSQIDDDSEVYKDGDEGTLVITAWIAKQKGIG